MVDKFSILNGVKCFSAVMFQNYLIFIPATKYIKDFTSTTWVKSQKSNGMPDEYLENITISYSNFAPILLDHH